MNIVFDIFLSNPALVDKVKADPELFGCLNEILEFVKGRLQPLKVEINKEEVDEPEVLKGTIIYLESPPEDPGRVLGIHGYSTILTERMAGSFADNDTEFMKQKVVNFLNSKRN
jgi:hypothetical protein